MLRRRRLLQDRVSAPPQALRQVRRRDPGHEVVGTLEFLAAVELERMGERLLKLGGLGGAERSGIGHGAWTVGQQREQSKNTCAASSKRRLTRYPVESRRDAIDTRERAAHG
jgi:hypothetical protein